MSCIQVTPYRPTIRLSRTTTPLPRLPPRPCTLPIRNNGAYKGSLKLVANASKHRRWTPISGYQICSPVCLFTGKEKPKSENEGTPGNALGNAVGSFKKSSIEDVLREQLTKKEYADEGGGGRKPPGSGGGGGGGDNSSGPEDGGLSGAIDEALQVILATIGFLFLYAYILSGEEMLRLLKDYIKYLFGGTKSARLIRAMEKWRNFFKTLTMKPVKVHPDFDKAFLANEILNTKTWYDSPEKYRFLRDMDRSDSEMEPFDLESNYDDDKIGFWGAIRAPLVEWVSTSWSEFNSGREGAESNSGSDESNSGSDESSSGSDWNE